MEDPDPGPRPDSTRTPYPGLQQLFQVQNPAPGQVPEPYPAKAKDMVQGVWYEPDQALADQGGAGEREELLAALKLLWPSETSGFSLVMPRVAAWRLLNEFLLGGSSPKKVVMVRDLAPAVTDQGDPPVLPPGDWPHRESVIPRPSQDPAQYNRITPKVAQDPVPGPVSGTLTGRLHK